MELRADNRSDLFSLGAVLFEMLTGERLFQGQTTADILEQVIAGHHPSPRDLNPAIPDGVMAILRTALQRDATRRYASAGEMGQACEHFLYDKGYGPTNLTLKQYLSTIFPEDALSEDMPGLSDDLIPMDEAAKDPGDLTPVVPLSARIPRPPPARPRGRR